MSGTPSERRKRAAVKQAVGEICKEVVRRVELRRRTSTGDVEGFLVRIAPTDARFKSGRTGVGGYDPRSSDSIDTFMRAVANIREATGCDVVLKSGSLVGIRYSKRLGDFSYSTLETVSAEALADDCRRRLERFCAASSEAGWPRRWADRQRRELVANPSGAVRKLEGREALTMLLQALAVYEAIPKPIWRRDLSVRAFNDSKWFELHLQGKFIAAACEVGACDVEMTEGEALQVLGFRTGASYALLSGQGSFAVGDSSVDIEDFGSEGLQLGEAFVRKIDGWKGVHCVLVVENETNFHVVSELSNEGLLVVYGGGQPNSATMFLLEVLNATLPECCPILLWSDIDLGGFRIVDRIREAVPRAVPFLMGASDFERYREAGRLLRHDDGYIYKLEAYLVGNHPLFADVCSACIATKGTVEQEAMLDGYAQTEIARLLTSLKAGRD